MVNSLIKSKHIFIIFCALKIGIKTTNAAGFKSNEISAGISTIMSSYSETTVFEENAFSGSALGINFNLNYEYFLRKKFSLFIDAHFPLLASEESSISVASIGFNMYFMGLGSVGSFTGDGLTIEYRPKLRYFAGVFAGPGSLVYVTEDSKKSDLFFEIGLHGGISYSFAKNYAARAFIGFGRASGSSTSSMNIRSGAMINYLF